MCIRDSYKPDIEKMRKAAQLIVGEHDFASFCKAEAKEHLQMCIRDRLTCELAMNIGRAAAIVLTKQKTHTGKARILIGKDTRISSDILESALIAEMCIRDSPYVVFSYTSVDGEEGFPGTLTLDVKYTLTADSIEICYNACLLYTSCYHIRCDLRLAKALSRYELYQHRQYHKLDR